MSMDFVEKRKASVLVVDDEESIRFTLSSFLEEEGYEVATAVDYDDAMNIVSADAFDLIYIDVILGGKSGIELLGDVKELSPTTEVIIVTGAPGVESASSALRLGALDYIVKPVRQEALLRSAAMAIRHKVLREEKEACRLNMEAIFRSVRDHIITVDNQLRVVETNTAVKHICDIERDEVVGKTIDELELDCSARCMRALRDTIARGRPVNQRHVECRASRSPNQIVSVRAAPLLQHDDVSSGGVMVIRNQTRIRELERKFREQRWSSRMVGRSDGIQGVLSMISALGDVQTSVLVTGESGTGKELVAEALHQAGRRRDAPFVTVNCSALSESLLESEIFGHVRGAFTGADRHKTGRFERAHGGTIFLDEIGDITQRMQLRFLRVLETMQFERVGDSTPINVDVRVVAATNKDLKEAVKSGDFREDLYYRLKVVEIRMPPLRERRTDIPLLVQHFIDLFKKKFDKQIHSVSEVVMDIFLEHDWPGNIRELENAMEHAFVLCQQQTITESDLPSELTKLAGSTVSAAAGNRPLGGLSRGEIIRLDEVELRYLEWALESYQGENNGLARELGLSERTFYRKLRKLRQDREKEEPPPLQ